MARSLSRDTLSVGGRLCLLPVKLDHRLVGQDLPPENGPWRDVGLLDAEVKLDDLASVVVNDGDKNRDPRSLAADLLGLGLDDHSDDAVQAFADAAVLRGVQGYALAGSGSVGVAMPSALAAAANCALIAAMCVLIASISSPM